MAGGAYVLLDPEAPPDRLALLVADSGAALVLAERPLAERFQGSTARLVEIEGAGEADEETAAGPFPVPAVGPGNLAYVVYTSGSTGQPKGVAVSHAGLSNLVSWHRAAYGLSPADRGTLIANPSFDAAVWELWPYLAAGASVHIPDEETRLSPRAVVRFWREEGITWSFLPTPLAEEVMAEMAEEAALEEGLALKGLLCGGDRLHRAPRPGLPFALINHYGPTEVSVVSTAAAVPPETPGAPPIGRPIHNVRCWVVDSRGGLAPRGARGELWIGGASLARGYLDRPALTAERFLPDPWSGEAGARLYRTGDLVRQRPDGGLEFLGRIDHQIKLRGFRIEPGEIEAALGQHPAVREAAVVVLHRRLIAYVVAAEGQAPSARELRGFLGERLPGYMVPAAYVTLPALPLTPSGKLDRGALPEPEPGAEESTAPRTRTEELVAAIFAEVLGVERAGVEADFFSLGGHSLLAIQVSMRVRSVLGVELPLRTLFEAPTVELLASRIEREAPAGDGALTRVSRDQPLELSFSQQRLWFLDQLDPGSPLYNIPAAVELTGKLDVAALAAALGEVVRRHEALRTSFPAVSGEPVQLIAEPAAFDLPLLDLQGLPEREREREASRLATADARWSFDLGRGPLLRLTLLRKAAEEHVALVTMHHIVSDGWSMGILVRELGALYAAFAAGQPSPLPELALQYADFAAWQRSRLSGELLEAEVAWWREQLAGLPPALELPTDHPRPADRGVRGAVHDFAIDGDSLAGLTALSQRRGATLFMTLLAGFAGLLQRSSGESDLAVGTPIAGRTRMETEPLIGFFINTLALRVDLSGGPSFEDLLDRVRETTLAAYAHQELPFDRLIEELAPERDRSRPPIFQVVLALQNASSDKLALPGLEVEVVPLSTGTAKFEMAVVLNEAAQGLSGLIEYSQDLFDAPTVGRLAGQLTRLLSEAAADPSRPLLELPLLSPGERHQLLAEWNDTAAPFPEATLLHQFFEAAVDRAPEAAAAVCAGRELTYAELDARSNRLASLLSDLGIWHGAPVGVWVERSLDMLIAVLGVLKVGGHYVALDEAWPADRVESILGSTGAPAIVAGPGLLPAVEEMRWRLPALTDVVCLAVAEPEPPAEPLDPESVRELWDFVAERAVDRVTAGGFVSAFTGQPMSEAEVDEYRDRVLSLAGPWLHRGARVLEIGSGSGLLLWEMASRVARVTGIDPSPRTQERNREHAQREGIANVDLLTGFAHELDGLLGGEERFDLVLLASTVQFFPGPRYLERVVRWALGRLAPGGALLIADVLDARRREELRQAVEEQRRQRGLDVMGGTGGAARRQELFLDEDLFRDLGAAAVHHRTEGFPNELRFRYDVLLTPAAGDGGRRKRLWTGWHVDRRPAGRLPQAGSPDDIAYVIHTSGSTGEPKGIVVQHRPAANLVDWINKTFEVGPEDRGLFVTSLCFDLSVYDIFGVLGAGGTVHVATRDELADPDHLVRLLRTGGITLWDSAPAALVQLAPLFPAEPDASSRLRRVLLSGDWIPVTLPDRVRHAFPRARVMALGGATEATVWSNWFPVGVVDPGWPSIPYGRPISNARYHVLDAGFAPCPIGVPGDLYIGGDCLCAGYRRPELTAKAFLPDPFSGAPGSRLYRTGDRARYLVDGNLEFLGRLDQQVKVRGYRIELGEIEVALARHPGLREAVVLVREDEPGDRRLVAYVVPSAEPCPSSAELRDGLRQTLPEYMIPSAFVALAELPVTPNGKLDRQALPAPQWSAGTGLVAPRTPVEKRLAAIWSDVLGVPQVGLEDNFFDLGGHSLLATQMVSRVRESFGVELALRTLFERPRLDELAAWLAGEEGEEGKEQAWGAPIVRVSREEPQVLSFAQQRLWFLDQLEPGSPVYNVPAAVELSGRLDEAALAAAFGEVVRRHKVLRTTFRMIAGQPMQVVAEPSGFDLPVVDLRGLPGRERDEETSRLAAAEARRPFDLARGPLLRAVLLRLGAEEHVALAVMHHVVSDGWSLGILVRELGAFYAAFLQGRPSPLPEFAVQYTDFAAWQRRHLSGELLKSELAWWRGHLAGMPQVLDLPADHPRPAVRTVRGAERGFTIGHETLAGLTGLCQRHGGTLFMTLLAGFLGLLQRYAGQDDLAVGTPIAGRNRVETEPLIGLFVNTLVLRGNLSGDPDFTELLDRARETTLSAYAHQDLPFERLVEELTPERDLSRPALVQVLFSLQNAPSGPLELPGLALTVSTVPTGTAKFDLACMLMETAQGIEGTFEYSRDLFEAQTIERLAGHFVRLLSGAVEAPRRLLSQLPLLSAAEREQLLVEWNDAGALPPSEVPIHALFEAQAARTPGATALVQGSTGERWTYAELDRWADSVAHRLAELGVGPEVRVGVCLTRTPLLAASLLGVLKAGGAYVPLDPRYPRERLAFLLEDTAAAVLLTEPGFVDKLPEHRAEVLLVEGSWRGTETAPRTASGVLPGNLAYLIYTSGSTGRPKGVAIEHRSAVAFARWARTVFPPEDLAGVLAATSIAFDLSVFELFVTLAWGGKVVLAENAMELPQLAAAGEVTLLNTVPSAMAELARLRAMPESVRTVNLAGEPLKRSLVEAIHESSASCRVLDLYGPSETTTYSTWGLAARDERREPAIGRPIAGTRLLVLDRGGEPVPVGVPGELLIGGAGLARGYLDRPDLTAERFVPDPFPPREGGEPGGRAYRTGDLVRYLPDGRLEYLGRIDHQIKVRGFRVEPGEIAAALAAHPWVRDAVVMAQKQSAGGQRLVAYVVGTPGEEPELSELRAFLRERLPDFMLPAAYAFLPSLPLTSNGKVDRQALARLSPERVTASAMVAPRTPSEELVAGIFADLLGVERVGVTEDFFALGGHSLLATQVASRVRSVFGIELPLRAIFEAPTVESLAGRLERMASAGERPRVPALVRVSRDEPLALSFAQQRLWFVDQFEPGSPLYNIPVKVALAGRLDSGALGAALGEVVRRHEALRTTFREVAGSPVQAVAERGRFALPLVDLQGLPGEAREREASRLEAAEARRPFDLGRGPLLRATLLASGPRRHALLLTMHHVVSDGWSMGVLVRELGVLYAAFLTGRPSPLPELAVQYADFAAWQRQHLSGELLETEVAWWRRQLAGMPPALELPTDRPRPAVRSGRGASHGFDIEGETLEGLRRVSRWHGATLFMTLLAGLGALLQRYTGEADLVIGTPIAGRTRTETEPLIGFFVNSLPLRVDLSGSPSFLELLGRVGETTLSAYAHQEVPFERLVEELAPERDRSRPPIFQVMLAFQGASADRLSLPGLEVESSALKTGTAKFDLTFFFGEAAPGLTGAIEYDCDLFDRATALRLAASLVRLLEGVVAAPQSRLAELPVLSPAERSALLFEWNDTAAMPRLEPLVHELIADQARRQPGALAVAAPGERLSYGELVERAGRIARLLRGLGVGPEVRVALCAGQTVHRAVGGLAVLWAGGAYVLLDPAAPPERLAFVVADSGATVVLAERALSDRVQVPGVRRVEIEEAGRSDGEAEPCPAPAVGPDNLAYVVYTSGSTGVPKGVAAPHRGLLNLVSWHGAAFGLSPADRATLIANPAFDASVWELWPYLAAGASVHIPDEETRVSPRAIVRFWRSEEITWSFLPTPLAEEVLADEAAVAGLALKGLLCGGDRLHRSPGVDLPFRLINHYGPSEASVISTSAAVAPGRPGAPPIGRPIQGTRTYVVDAWGALMPRGGGGELWLGGVHLARGYHARPDLTAERFLPDPWSGEAGARLYRTGDRVRYLPDGGLEFLGRLDHQVKLRGYRIELGEIESALAGHPGVREAVVLAREDEPRKKRLIAYVVPAVEPAPAPEDLRDALRRSLPEYMIPSAFVNLEELPTTPNGKLDRQALPVPEWSAGAGFTAPRTPTEEILAEIWSAVLGVPRVGREDNFFDLGGHSLLATQMVSRLREGRGVELSLRTLFEKPKLADLARAVDAAIRTGEQPRPVPALRPAASAGPGLPLSFAQERLWFLQQLDPGSDTYNMPVAVELSGSLRPGALVAALVEVVRRQESLRTTFAAVDGHPRQRISPSARVPLPLVDLSALPAPEGLGEVERLEREQAGQGFDLENGPLAAALLVRLGEDRHRFLLTLHHIISDGWSIGVLVRELGALYAASVEGRPSPLPRLPIQYADFAVWQREELAGKRDAELAYWEARLGGEVAFAELPADRPRPAVQTFSGGSRQLVLPPDLTARLRSFGHDQGATLFMTLLAATQALLSRHSGEHDVPVGAPVAGRQWSETEGLIGCFLNTLVLRTDLSGSPSFRELTARVRTVTLEAYSHQDVPFEAILARLRLDRDLSRTPLFQVLFNMLNLPRAELSLPGLDLRALTPAEAPSKFDMTFYVSESESSVGVNLVYNAGLFDEARMTDVLAQLEMLLGQAMDRPDDPVDQLSLVTNLSRNLLPDPTMPLDQSWLGGVHELFAAQAERAPERPAVFGGVGGVGGVDGDVVWSYGDLLEGSRRLAGWLAAHGVRPGDPVAILAHRSAPLVQAVLGVLTAGAAFAVLDPAYPAPRLVEMLRLAAPRAWVGLQAAGPVPDEVRSWLDAAGCPCLELPAGGFAALESLAGFSGGAPRVTVGPRDPACIGFTSGSTGGSKGILGLHGSLSHFLPAYCKEFEVGPDDRFSLLSGLSHDPLQRDIFTPLYLGAAIVVPDPADIGIAGRLAEWMNRHSVTVAHLTPALGQLLAERPPGGEGVVVPSLRVVTLVGEALTRQDVARLRAMAPGVTCINLYGSTETQRALSFHRVTPEEAEAASELAKQVLPLGRGMQDVQLLVLQRAGGLAGIGEIGEIAVRSPHLARGYIGSTELSAERFQLNPFTGEAGDRIYRTGDLGRYLPNGEVSFAGRSDFQVKLRGFRIELGEIEALLAGHPGVREAAVLLREDLPGGRGLVAYAAVTAVTAPGTVTAGELHDYLWQRLPAYMVPSAFALLDSLPLTPNGKVDRRALARVEWEAPFSGGEPRAPRTPVEEIVARICAEVLKVPRVGPGDNFFQLGGHSLIGAQVVSRLRQVFRVDLPLRVLFAAPTVAGMAAEIERLRRDGAPERPAISSFRQDRGAPPPLSFAQERFWAGRQLEARTVASTIPILVAFEGRLDLACLRRAMREIVDRHEVLRTSFRDGAEGPVQVVHAAVPVRFPVVDLEGMAPGRRRAEIERWSTLDGRSHFDYERGPLFRTTVFRCSERENVVLFTIHHVAFDGWSTSVLLGELAALYNAFREGRPSPLRPLAAQYQDFARWQRQTLAGEALAAQVTFWREHLRGAVPLDLANLANLAKGRRPARPTFEAGIETFTVPEELERKLDAFAAEQSVTLFMTLLAAFKVLLHQETGRSDIVVTSLFANRNQVEIENLIGNFYAGLPLRTRLAGAHTFRDLLQRVRDVTLAAHEHPDILYEPVMAGMSFLEKGDRGGLATFRILFQLAKLPPAEQELSDVKVTRLPFDTGKIRQDLSLFLSQSGRLAGRFKYNRDVLDPERVARLRDRYLRILEDAVDDPDCLLEACGVEVRTSLPAPRPIPIPAAIGPGLPLSFAQERLWLLEQLDPGSSTYNMPAAVELSGALDPRALSAALTEVARRQESLRTTFVEAAGSPRQRIAPPPSAFPLPLVDLSALPAPQGLSEAERLEREQAGRGFDLETGPLAVALLLRLSGDRHRFLLNLHHIISDGWSIGVLVSEVGALYAAAVAGRPSPLPELPIQYADFAVWQREQVAATGEAELAHWERRLGGEIAPAELPTDRPRPAVQTFRGGGRRLALSADLTARLKRFSREEGATLFMTLLAAAQALLSRHSGEQDVAVGAPIAGRQRVETEGLIGCFLNTLVLRTDLSGLPSFRELVSRVREVTLDAYANQDVPFEAVLSRLRLDRDLSRSSLFQVLFNMLNLPRYELSLPGLSLRVLTPAEIPSKLDLTFYLSEVDASVRINLVYNADLFDEARIVDLLAQLELLLAQAVERREEPVDGLPLLTAAARALLPDPGEALAEPSFPPVADLFLERERDLPEEEALRWSEGAWTYSQLGTRAREIARAILATGGGPGAVIAVSGPRSPELIASLLGVFLSGGVLLMLDRKVPAARLRLMVEEAKPVCLVYVGEERPEDAWLLESVPMLQMLPPEAPAAEFPRPAPDDPAYVFFTSGTTGKPKAVLGRQKGLSHFLVWQREAFGIGPGDRAAQLTGLSFDVVLRDVFLPLTGGATLCLPDEDDFSPDRILAWLAEREITVVHTVPSLASAWLAAAPEGFGSDALRWTFFAGEPLLDQVVERWRAAFPRTAVVNLYGPTETTLAKCFYRVPDRPVASVQPVGSPLPQTQALVLANGGRRCGIGEAGEIVLRTPFRSLGYLGNPEEARLRFRPNPFRDDAGDLLYFTGDRGRYRLDGTLEILGRLDEQVKIRGVRVEPAEIRLALGRHAGVWESAVLAREVRPGDQLLVAYVVPRPGAAPDPEDLRRHLRRELPEAMVPSAFLILDALPLTPNGKLDRRALARYEVEIPASGGRTLLTPVEEIVAGLWSEVLGLPRVGPDDNFFQLGGHSLTGARVFSRLRQVLQADLPLRLLFEAPTVAGLAAEIERRRRPGDSPARPARPARPAISSFSQDRSSPPPLSFAQERFWAGRQLEARSVASTIPVLVLFEGPLDLVCLRRALLEIVERHEVLRTSFREAADGPIQVVQPTVPLEIPVVDLERVAPSGRMEEVRHWSTLDGRSHFDLERGPLFRLTLFRCSERENVLLFTVHHITFDGWSHSVLVGELAALYNAFREGRPSPLRPLAAQYQDFARWQRQTLAGEALAEEVAFWREHLRGAVPLDLANLANLAKGRRPARPTFEAGIETFTVPEELERKLDAFAAEHCVTLFMTLLAAFKALLHVETGRDDIVVTSLFANRNQVETENLIGNFYAGLPLRTRLSGARTFRDLLERVRDVTLAAHEHPDILYEPVMEGMSFLEKGDRGGLATFRILFQLAKLPPVEQGLSDLKVIRLPFDTGKIRQDLSLFLSQSGRLAGRFKYNRDVLDPERVVRLRDRYLRILEAVVADPDGPLAELSEESSVLLSVGEAR
jgi:amino acid adenylation domain-containing protein